MLEVAGVEDLVAGGDLHVVDEPARAREAGVGRVGEAHDRALARQRADVVGVVDEAGVAVLAAHAVERLRAGRVRRARAGQAVAVLALAVAAVGVLLLGRRVALLRGEGLVGLAAVGGAQDEAVVEVPLDVPARLEGQLHRRARGQVGERGDGDVDVVALGRGAAEVVAGLRPEQVRARGDLGGIDDLPRGQLGHLGLAVVDGVALQRVGLARGRAPVDAMRVGLR